MGPNRGTLVVDDSLEKWLLPLAWSRGSREGGTGVDWAGWVAGVVLGAQQERGERTNVPAVGNSMADGGQGRRWGWETGL